jgi:hypothetical protein
MGALNKHVGSKKRSWIPAFAGMTGYFFVLNEK